MTRRAAAIFALLLFIGGASACWCGLALDWDGAYQFALCLIQQSPFRYLSRFHSWLVWWPTVWASRATDNMKILEMFFGAPFCFAPLTGFLLAWGTARRHAPRALFWAACGIGFGMLPGQAFMINDSLFQIHLFWPFFLCAICPASAWLRCLIGALGIFQLSHPIGIGLCVLAALAALDSAKRRPLQRVSFVCFAAWSALLCVVSILKLFIFPDPYAAHEASFEMLAIYFWQGVFGLPLLSIVCFWAAVWTARKMELNAGIPRERRAWLLLFAAGACLLYWAADPHRWWKALDFRRWLVPLNLPFFLLAWWDARHREPLAASQLRFRSIASCGVGAIFALVLSVQSIVWLGMCRRLDAQVRAEGDAVLPSAALSWTAQTVMDHWATSAMVVLLQGAAPHTLELDEKQVAALRDQKKPGMVPLIPTHDIPATAGPRGWFDFQPVMSRILADPNPDSP